MMFMKLWWRRLTHKGRHRPANVVPAAAPVAGTTDRESADSRGGSR